MACFPRDYGVRVCDFSLLQPSSSVSRHFSADKWHLIDYNSVAGKGTMLAARKGLTLPQVSMPLNLKGWHKLYVCLLCDNWNVRPGISLQVSGDTGASFMTRPAPQPGEYTWKPEENGCEFFWECADLTDRELIINRLSDGLTSMIALLWIRAVPMTDVETAEYLKEKSRRDTKKLHVHTDLDWLGMLTDASGKDVLAPFVHDVSKSDADMVSVEIYPLLNAYSWLAQHEANGTMSYVDNRSVRHKEYSENRSKILTALTDTGHSSGLKIYAALRIALAQMPPPYELGCIRGTIFSEAHPEYFCVDRDGETITTISLAFPEVREYIVDELLKVIEYGFDGVTIFTHRGILTLFEQPVLERFAELYPGVDPRCLPLTDARLQKVHCSFITEFITLLRNRLDEYSKQHGCPAKGINILCGFSCEADKCYGIDVASWAEAGLIDSFIPSNMIVWEDDSLFRDPENPEMISIEKYKEVKYHGELNPIKRIFTDDLERVLKELPHHLDISRKTGVKCYIEMPWECTRTTEYLYDYAAKLLDAGAENISLWDSYHVRVMNRDEWNLVSQMGHTKEFASISGKRTDYVKLYRILSLDNVSIASYHPLWRG